VSYWGNCGVVEIKGKMAGSVLFSLESIGE